MAQNLQSDVQQLQNEDELKARLDVRSRQLNDSNSLVSMHQFSKQV